MMEATHEEMRELSRRTRRAHAAAMIALLGTLVLLPVVTFVWLNAPQWSTWAAWGAAFAGGALLMGYAFVAGKARGAFRRVFRRMKDDAKRARTLTPTGPEPQMPPHYGR